MVNEYEQLNEDHKLLKSQLSKLEDERSFYLSGNKESEKEVEKLRAEVMDLRKEQNRMREEGMSKK